MIAYKKGKARLCAYLNEHVEQLQVMKQHHVHVKNPITHIREPLRACRRKDNPTLCKAEFPIMQLLVQRAVTLCSNLCR